MSKMRAKMVIDSVEKFEGGENLQFRAICKDDSYGEDGLDENNTFATFTPSAEVKMMVTNPALAGEFEVGQTFYVDFTEVE